MSKKIRKVKEEVEVTERDWEIINSYLLHDDDDISDATLLALVMDDCQCTMEEFISAIVETDEVEKYYRDMRRIEAEKEKIRRRNRDKERAKKYARN